VAVLLAAAPARAQPAPAPDPPVPDPAPAPAPDPAAPPPAPDPAGPPPAAPSVEIDPAVADAIRAERAAEAARSAARAARARALTAQIQAAPGMPEVIAIPTGWLLPAAVIYSRSSLDTGGGAAGDLRIGLGDVAELGVSTLGVRERVDDSDAQPERGRAFVTASFRLGVAEHRLFRHQPGVALGFRKSFERKRDGRTSQLAELALVASKRLGARVAVHVGGAFWDASLSGALDAAADAPPREVTLHGLDDLGAQLRPFGGIELRTLPRSLILIDLSWAPELCARCAADADKIRLRPTLAWGVRYDLAHWAAVESGVRVPDIGDANLLDAQIFGQLTMRSWRLRRRIDQLQ
jgi:hypothetical protein